jgi:hypothetical protein
MSGFDITLLADSTVLQPADADLAGTILLGTPTILGKCIGGVASQGTCGPAASGHADTLELAVSAGGGTTSAPTSGLLFTAIYNIIGTTSGPMTIGFENGPNCTPSSHGNLCVQVGNGTTSSVPVNLIVTASFDNTISNFIATLNPPNVIIPAPGASVTSTLTITAVATFTGMVTLTIPASSAGLTPSLNQTSIDLSISTVGAALLTVNTSATMGTGNYTVTVRASGGGQVTNVIFIITISIVHNVSVSSFTVSPSSATATAGDQITFSIIVHNSGSVSESVTVDALANNATVASANVTIAAGQDLTVTLHWDTTGYATDQAITYQLGAKVLKVPSESNTADNMKISGTLALSPAPSSSTLSPLIIAIIIIAAAIILAVVILVVRRRRPTPVL